jgi:hypothetical protein
MTARRWSLALVLLFAAFAPVRGEEIVLAEGGQSAYRIVVADDASPSIRHGAEELQTFLQEMTGAKLPIVSDKTAAGPKEIILGNNARLAALKLQIDFQPLGREGYVIRTVGPHVVIAGGDLRGTMYGVYGLLEDHLGCRWFAPGVSRIPKSKRLALPALDERKVPALEYREPFTNDCFDGDWCARNRMNSSTGRLEAKHGGKVRFGDGFFVHTFDRLVPPGKYFAQHPEYFSLVKGKRLKETSQLCCTNEDVIRICTEGIREAMKAQPGAFVFSVSQNDWYNFCECDKCQAIAKQEDSQIGPVLQLVNRVAEAVEKEFPDKAVETLAYQWTRRPPKQMRPRGPRPLGQGLQPPLGVGLRHRFLQLPAPLPEPAGPQRQHQAAGRQQRDRDLRAGHVRHPAERDGGAGRVHDRQVPLEPRLRRKRRHERVPRRVLRQGRGPYPQVSRSPARLRREEEHPRQDLGRAR